MRSQDLIFKLKWQSLILLLSVGLMVSASMAFAQESQRKSGQGEGFAREESQSKGSAYNAWILAVRYRFEEIPGNYDINQDPKMGEIWSLRGDDLRYFLDFIEAINQVQNIMFPPSSSENTRTQSITLDEERELIGIVTEDVFFRGANNRTIQASSEHDKVYVAELSMILNAILNGDGDKFFTSEYLQYRTGIIAFIEDTGSKLFNPSEEAIDHYFEYFSINKEEVMDISPNLAPEAACEITYTIDNWPAKSTIFSGNTGTSWREAKAHDQTDCDIFVSYPMGTTPQYGRISANTSSAQCVLDNSPQLRGAWVGNFNNVQYGKVTVTWVWPFGCHTTGNALRQATKWRP